MSDIVEILRAKARHQPNSMGDQWGDFWVDVAADAIARLYAERAELVEALERDVARYERLAETALKWQRVLVRNEIAVERWRRIQVMANKGRQQALTALSRAHSDPHDSEGETG